MMRKSPMIGFAVAAAAGLACLLLLLFMSPGRFTSIPATTPLSATQVPARDIWMNVLLNGKKIGYSHSSLKPVSPGFQIRESLSLRFTVMGITQPVRMDTLAKLHPDFSLASFDFAIWSGMFRFSANGRITGKHNLEITASNGGSQSVRKINLDSPPFLASSLLYAVATKNNLRKNDRFTFFVFDPATMGNSPATVTVAGNETIRNMGMDVKTTRLFIDFAGARETAWIDAAGNVIKESGIMGLSLERTDRDDALLRGPGGSGTDLVKMASIPSNMVIKDPAGARRLVVEISGINTNRLSLSGGRQSFSGNRLTVVLEAANGLPGIHRVSDPKAFEKYLAPGPFVESDDPKIIALAATLVSPEKSLYENARALWAWVNKNIEKRPVISVPDALSTLENRVGDCNEHSALLCALARAAGIPAKIETGLVYMRGRFYYHSWNSLYVGKWITADAALGQFPADVTHLRLISGSVENQLDYAGIIGSIRISVVSVK